MVEGTTSSHEWEIKWEEARRRGEAEAECEWRLFNEKADWIIEQIELLEKEQKGSYY